ncbi:MAG: hypothetical protein M1530_03245 [Candidatus Marsarchaeota archaeon]|nr:hypothetical protein [Candidatus Marsarchaeota archaeon]
MAVKLNKLKVLAVDARIKSRAGKHVHSLYYERYHAVPDSTIERRLVKLERELEGLGLSPEATMAYLGEIGRLRGQYVNENAYPASSKYIIKSIFLRAKDEFAKSNGKSEICKN